MSKQCTEDLSNIWLPSERYSLWGLCLVSNRDVIVVRMQFRCLDNGEKAFEKQKIDSWEKHGSNVTFSTVASFYIQSRKFKLIPIFSYYIEIGYCFECYYVRNSIEQEDSEN